MSDTVTPRYNLFAAVLEDLIATAPLHNPGASLRPARLEDLTLLGAMDDFQGIDDRLHPETVRR